MHVVSNNISPSQIGNLFNYQHNIHSYYPRLLTIGNFFLEYSRINKQIVSYSRNGVRIWNSLSSELRQMPKTKFKRNIHNMLLQKLLEANEYIDFFGFEYASENRTYYICIILPAPHVICSIFPWFFLCFVFLFFPTVILVNIQFHHYEFWGEKAGKWKDHRDLVKLRYLYSKFRWF